MGKRYLMAKSKRFYVERDRYGRFKKFTRKGRSLRIDRRIKAKRKVKSGYGHRGDLMTGFANQML